jgi:hypothetical protein
MPEYHQNPWEGIRSRGLRIAFVLKIEATGVYAVWAPRAFGFALVTVPN